MSHFVTEKATYYVGTNLRIDGYNCRITDLVSNLSVYHGNKFIVYDKAIEYVWPLHSKGKCGLPLIAEIGNGTAIVGFHAAGNEFTHKCYGVRLYRENLEDAIAKILEISKDYRVVSEADIDFVEEPITKSIVNFEAISNFDYLGKLGGNVMANQKSKLVKTKFSPFLDEFFIDYMHKLPDERYSRPLMKSVVREGEWISPINNAIRKLDKKKYFLDRDLVKEVVETYSSYIKGGIKDLEGKLRPLTITAAINGAESDPFIKRMSANTSSGLEWAER